MKLKYLKSDYVPKGQLEDFPLEIIDKMIERQVEQGNEANVEVFEHHLSNDYYGFLWDKTIEGYDFWCDIINGSRFNLFFEKYPKEKPLEFPRVIEVRYTDENCWMKRVCIKMVNGEAVCWINAETLEEAEKEKSTATWIYWREVEEPKEEYKPFDFSDGVKDYLDLLGKKIVSKDGKSSEIISNIGCNEEGVSEINGADAEYYYFHEFLFEDGSPVGVKM